MTLEEALASPTYPPAEASLALLAFLRDELPLGGTAAEARLIRLFPLLVSRIVGGLNAADGHRHAAAHVPCDPRAAARQRRLMR